MFHLFNIAFITSM